MTGSFARSTARLKPLALAALAVVSMAACSSDEPAPDPTDVPIATVTSTTAAPIDTTLPATSDVVTTDPEPESEPTDVVTTDSIANDRPLVINGPASVDPDDQVDGVPVTATPDE